MSAEKIINVSDESGSPFEGFKDIDSAPQIIYENTDLGPFKVSVLEDDGKNINSIKIGRDLVKQGYEIKDIIKKNKTRAEIICFSAEDANKITKDKKLKELGYNTKILINYVATTGFISDIPIDIESSELINNIKTNGRILNTFRITKKIDNKIEITEKVGINFRDKDIPNKIKLYNVTIKVEQNTPKLIMCYNCLLYGHPATKCYRQPKCQNCAIPGHEPDDCINETKCLYCKTNHKTTSSDCPEREIQKNIAHVMFYQKLSYEEASENIKTTQTETTNINTENNSNDVLNKILNTEEKRTNEEMDSIETEIEFLRNIPSPSKTAINPINTNQRENQQTKIKQIINNENKNTNKNKNLIGQTNKVSKVIPIKRNTRLNSKT